MASKRTAAKLAYVTAAPGVPVRVIRDGGTYDHSGIILSVDLDDEQLGGTWMTIVVDPDAPERTQLSALRLDTEQECRDRSAADRRRYYTWCVE
jgi:hypothetical protein